MSTNNAINFAKPLPLAYMQFNASTGAVTGDGTIYTILWNLIRYDLGSNVAASAFTAPYTGKYFIRCHLALSGLAAAHTYGQLKIGTAGNYLTSTMNPGAVRDGNSRARISLGGILSLTSGDIVTATIQVSNGALSVGMHDDGITADSRHAIFYLNH